MTSEWAAIMPYKMSLWLAEKLTEIVTYSSSIAGIKRPTMSVWLPFCVNKHTNILLWLAERWNEPSYIE